MALLLLLVISLAFACAGDDDDDNDDVGDDDDDNDDDDNDDNDNDDDNNDDDDDDDTTPEGLPTFSKFVTPNESPLPPSVDACAVYRQEQCQTGTVHRCAIYDGGSKDWVVDPDPWVEQTFNYDRYFDLYNRMEGQHAAFIMTQSMPPGTPEETWSDPQYFQEYDGYGDAAGWTGTALLAAAARYASTGTDADYERMLAHFESTAFQYEANEIPGLLIRSHFAMMEEGGPSHPIGLAGMAVTEYHEPGDWHFRYPLSEAMLERLPAYYTEGVEVGGEHWDVTPVWMGDASRDMYVRGLPGVMLAYDLLEDQGPREQHLRQVIQTEIPCTLNRMKKMRIRNLQSNPIIVEAVAAYLGSDRLLLDPDDIDITQVDEITAYVMEQPNPDYMDAFDDTCPDGPPMEVDPEYDFDASDFLGFMLDFTQLVIRMQRQGVVPVAWLMAPTVNGGEIVFMTQWALAAHYLTGDSRYLDFVEGLQQELQYWEVINLMGSFYMPKWCRPHYGPSLLYPSLWNMQNRIDKSIYPEYWTNLAGAIAEEMRHKDLEQANDGYFGILYGTMVDDQVDAGRQDYLDFIVDMLANAGQYGVTDRNEPRRNYSVDWREDPPPGVQIEELSEDDRDMYLEDITLFGLVIVEGWIEDEFARAVEGMPVQYRVPGDFQWQMDPFMLYRSYGGREATVQYAAMGFPVTYWVGRMQGLIDAGAGTALGWQDTGVPCDVE